MGLSLDANAECPFFISQDDKHINCEGYLGKKVKHSNAFSKKCDKMTYFDEVCCCNGGKSCMHYKVMSYLYDSGVLK